MKLQGKTSGEADDGVCMFGSRNSKVVGMIKVTRKRERGWR